MQEGTRCEVKNLNGVRFIAAAIGSSHIPPSSIVHARSLTYIFRAPRIRDQEADQRDEPRRACRVLDARVLGHDPLDLPPPLERVVARLSLHARPGTPPSQRLGRGC